MSHTVDISDKAIDKEFQIDDTAMATQQITTKLDQLEKIVRKGPINLRDKIMRQNTLSSILATPQADEGGFRNASAKSSRKTSNVGRLNQANHNSLSCSDISSITYGCRTDTCRVRPIKS